MRTFGDQCFQVRLPTFEVGERITILQSEPDWFGGVIKAHDADFCRRVTNRLQEGERVGGGAQSNVPNDEFAGCFAHFFNQAKLVNIKSLRFCYRPDDRMKSLAVAFGAKAIGTVGELDDVVLI